MKELRLEREEGAEGGQGERGGNQLDGCTVTVSPRVRTMGLGAVANYRGPGVWSRIQEHPNYRCALS